MAAFGADGRCLMRALREELDDPDPQDCGVCAVCTAPRYAGPLDPALVREAALNLRSRPLLLDVKKMAPDPEGKMRKLGDDVRAEEGRALARLGDGGWDPLVQAGRREGRFDDELVAAAAEAVRTWRAPVRWVAAVPSRRSGPLVPDFAQRLAAALGLPFHPVLERVGDNPPQREMTNSVQQVANVRGEFAVTHGPPPEGVPARRRHPLQRLDAGDGRGPAAAQGRRARSIRLPCPPPSRYNLHVVVGSVVLRLRRTFTRALLAGDPEAAERAVREAMDGGLTAAQIDVELIAPALLHRGREVGAGGDHRRRRAPRARRSRCACSRSSAWLHRTERRRRLRRVLLLAPEGERHVIGLNMACDLLLAAGYETRMLGADVPLADIAAAVTRHQADIVALTATMADSVERVDARAGLPARRPSAGRDRAGRQRGDLRARRGLERRRSARTCRASWRASTRSSTAPRSTE